MRRKRLGRLMRPARDQGLRAASLVASDSILKGDAPSSSLLARVRSHYCSCDALLEALLHKLDMYVDCCLPLYDTKHWPCRRYF